jgi:hypothetical protein
MREQHELGTFFGDFFERGNTRLNAGCVLERVCFFVHRLIDVDSAQDGFSGELNIIKRIDTESHNILLKTSLPLKNRDA